MIVAEFLRLQIDPLAWAILPRIDLGPVAVSPHGIGIALGYLLGAQVMVRRARRTGGPDEADIWNALFWALIGAIVGARVGYVIGHLKEVTDSGEDVLAILRVWEGGISLLGGMTGAVLAALPYIRAKRLGFWRMIDLAAPGLALGIVVGRIGDLVIGDHIGTPTSFPLGWRCLGEAGDPPAAASIYRAALEAGVAPSAGCYDLVVHQTALYDLLSSAVLLAVLVALGRTPRRPGFAALVFAAWYGSVRVVTDFLRVDRRYAGLTGSQILALTVVVAALYLLARHRGAPPAHAELPTAVRDDDAAPAEGRDASPGNGT